MLLGDRRGHLANFSQKQQLQMASTRRYRVTSLCKCHNVISFQVDAADLHKPDLRGSSGRFCQTLWQEKHNFSTAHSENMAFSHL